MSWWSKIKEGYTSVDKKLGGYLPGGVKPGSTSSPSPSSSSPTSSTSSSSSSSSSPQSQTTTTQTTTSGTTSSRSSGGSSSSGRLGYYYDIDTGEVYTKPETQSGGFTKVTQPISYGGKTIQPSTSTGITTISQEDRIRPVTNNTNLTPTTKQQTQQQTGNTLAPQAATMSAYNYNPTNPPQRYEQSIGQGLKTSFKNVFNFGVIGKKGGNAYIQQAFFEPFEYVGKPKAYSDMRNLNLENWQGTDFAYGVPEEDKNKYRPDMFQTKTFYEEGEKQKQELFKEAGLNYKGEPAVILPQRISEDVVSDLKPKYTERLNKQTGELYNFYQGKVNAGELTAEEAQIKFESDVNRQTNLINTAFQSEATAQFNERYTSKSSYYNKRIGEIQQFQAEIFEPPAYPIIRNTGKVIETGAIIGATTFGGSGVTLAASAYIGARTVGEANEYTANFNQLTTKQKILGGAGIAAGFAATLYTARLGETKFYNEWRQIRYTDVANARANVRGVEVLKTKDLTQYNIISKRSTSLGNSITVQNVNVYQTGADRIGFSGTGATKTTIWDPQYYKYVSNTQTFTTRGYIPNIKEGAVVFGNAKGAIGQEGFSSGVGRSMYITDTNVKDFNFIAASKDQGSFYSIAGGKNPSRSFSGSITPGINYKSTAVRGTLDSTGQIYKLPTDTGIKTVITSGNARSSQQFINNLYGVGGSAAQQTTKQAQTAALRDLSKSVGSYSTTQQTTTQISRTITPNLNANTYQIQETSPQYSLKFGQLPQLSQLLPQQNKVNTVLTYSVPTSSSASASRSAQIVTPIQNISPILATAPGLKMRQGLINPTTTGGQGFFNAPPSSFTGFAPPFRFDLNPGGLALPSNIVRGGKRRTSYTPSYSALVFNIKGSYGGTDALARSGIDFRPITKNFSFNTGLNAINLKKLFKR